MSPNPFDPTFDQLPGSLPIFPLTGVLLLPRSRLPLNIFEPRYLAMTEDALASGGRLIGMVQPTAAEEAGRPPPVYRTGCAGRITSFSETEDGRYLITLSGICRFDIAEEMPTTRGYRRVVPDWAPYRADLSGPESSAMLDRARLLSGLKGYFRQTGLTANWEAVESTPDERLVNSLAMICPFDASEKQALLEAPTLEERARMMTTMMEMAVLDPHDGDTVSRH